MRLMPTSPIYQAVKRLENLETKSRYTFRRLFKKQKYSDYNEFYSTFKWDIPNKFNMGVECCDYHIHTGNGDNLALINHEPKVFNI